MSFPSVFKKMCNHEATKEKTKERKNSVLDTAPELYNDLSEIYLDEYIKVSANNK